MIIVRRKRDDVQTVDPEHTVTIVCTVQTEHNVSSSPQRYSQYNKQQDRLQAWTERRQLEESMQEDHLF